ncbi:hypothetical protein EAY03_20225, partial [Vibrio anguillarum]
IQEELAPIYNHNVEKFGVQEPSKIIRDIKDLENIEPNDYLIVHSAYYIREGGYYLFFEGDLKKNHESLYSLLISSCVHGDIKKFINAAN